MQADNILYVLTGPTAVGKTELSLRWAEHFGAEILSADSLLFYQGMDIGTAKPSREERARVPHHLIDIVPVDEPLNVSQYVELALEAVHDIQGRSKRVLITGGSGFYLKSFYDAVADSTIPDPAIREEVEQLEREGGLAAMLTRLRELNPAGLGRLDILNPRRVSRALERCLSSGKTLLELERLFSALASPFEGWTKKTVLLERSRASMLERINERTSTMLRAGLVEEVRRLRENGLLQNPSAARAIGYRETLSYLDEKDADLADLQHKVSISTRQLVAKQRKWFRAQLEPDHIVDLDAGAPDVQALFG